MTWLRLLVLLAALIPILALLNMGCGRNTEPAWPSWVADLIEESKNQPVWNPPRSIWQCVYDGQIVYVVSEWGGTAFVHDYEGDYICMPSGGVAGWGDGECPDFFEECTDLKLIWKDSRGQ